MTSGSGMGFLVHCILVVLHDVPITSCSVPLCALLRHLRVLGIPAQMALSRRAKLLNESSIDLSKMIAEEERPICDACALSNTGGVALLLRQGSFRALTLHGTVIGSVQKAHAASAQICAVRGSLPKRIGQHADVVCTAGPDEASLEDTSQCVKAWVIHADGSSVQQMRSSMKLFNSNAPAPTRERNNRNVHGSSVMLGASKPCALDAVMDHNSSQLSVAVGLNDGSVSIARVELGRDRIGRHRIGAPEGASSPVTHVAWRIDGSHSLLYVASESAIACYDVDASCTRLLYDNTGAKRQCASLSSKQELVVAQSEAAYFYDAEGRGSALALAGEKRALSVFAGHLVAIVEPSGRATQAQLQVYDLQHKLIAYEGPAGDADLVVSCADGHWVLFLQRNQSVSSESEVHQRKPHSGHFGKDDTASHAWNATVLTEKNTVEKLDVLCERELFEVALKLSRNENAPQTKVAEVQRKYGDSLYAKHDYDGAMRQYLETVGYLEPSHVVRLFLDANRITNLTSYLERLHSYAIANADHTTLLLNCYIKLQDVAKLDAFLLGDPPGMSGDDYESIDATTKYRRRFDVETVIQVCRSAGYSEHANQVAARAGERELRLSILMEDLQRFDEAIELLRSYPDDQVERAVRRFGRRLLQEQPARTAEVLREICDPSKEEGIRRAASMLGIFSEHPYSLANLLEGIIPAIPRYVNLSDEPSPAERTLYNTYIEVLLRETLDSMNEAVAPSKGTESSDREKEASERWRSLDQAPFGDEALCSKSERRRRALQVLKQGWPTGGSARYDKDHLLVLCQRRGFREGSILLFERMKRYDDVLRCYMDAQDYRGLLDAASRFGQSEPQLWFEVLSYLASQSGDLSKEVEEALSHIEHGRLLPPLLVLQTLSHNPQLPLRVVKGYVSRALAEETAAIERETAAVEHNRKETERMSAELTSLQSEPQVFQNNRCTLCQAPLDLPAVHFLCMHSYHRRCLGDAEEPECPQCAGEHREVNAIKQSFDTSHLNQERFFQSLENTSDTFGAIANNFQRGAMRNTST